MLNDAKQCIYRELCNGTKPYDSIMIHKGIVFDREIFKRALKTYYEENGFSKTAYRKRCHDVMKKIEQNNEDISEKVIDIFVCISKEMKK